MANEGRRIQHVRRHMRGLCVVLTLALFGTAFAAPPPFGTWMRVQVKSCQPVEFFAPDDELAASAQGYLPGDRRRATLIVGRVLAAKNFTLDGKWPFTFDPPAAELLGASFVGFVNETRSNSCPSTLPSDVEFVQVHGCDVGGRRDLCIAPVQQVRPVSSHERLEFVSR